MNEGISFSFSLDQVTVENDEHEDGETENLQYFCGVLEQTKDGPEQKYYIVYDNQLNSNKPSSNFEIGNVPSKTPQPNSVQADQCGSLFEDLQKSFEELDESHPYLIHKDNDANRTVMHMVGVSKKIQQESEKDLHHLLDSVNALTEYNKRDEEMKSEDTTKKKVGVWKCEHCPDLIFLSRSSHQRHRSRQHKPSPKNYPCTECELTFPLARRLKSHMLSEHQHYRPYKCTICSRNFSKSLDLEKHASTHDPFSNLPRTNSPKKYDQARVEESKPIVEQKVYPCTQCELSFPFPSRLKSHVRTVHQKHRPHECPTCSKRFSSIADMKKHVDIHTQSKTHTCAACGRQFTDASNLARHTLTHSKVKPHVCPVCGKRYFQLSSLRKHRTNSAAAIFGKCGDELETSGKANRRYHCRICGHSFNSKRLLREHSESHEANNNVSNLGRSVDALIQDILQEDNDGIPQIENQTLNEPNENFEPIEITLHESLSNYYEVELINEIDRLEHLSENVAQNPLLQPDSFTSNVDNIDNISEYIQLRYSVKEENLNTVNNDISQELFSNSHSEINTSIAEQNEECATIFESDVDLESSAILAASLNQLMAESSVEFVSTEHDDTFIINLNTSMDAEQLSDLLNIGIEVVQENGNETPEQNPNENVSKHRALKRVRGDKKKRSKSLRCKLCSKTFRKRENYISHIGNHDPTLSRHQCHVCSKRFGYRSTLNKHIRNAHTPTVWMPHACHLCGDIFKHRWMLKDHKNSKHRKLRPFRCEVETCRKQFHKRSDFLYHCRQHTGERPYKCAVCGRRFAHASHRAKHKRRCAMRGPNSKARHADIRSNIDKELLSDIDDLLRSKMVDSE